MGRILAILVLTCGGSFASAQMQSEHFFSDQFLSSYMTIQSYELEAIPEILDASPIIEDDCRAPVSDPTAIPTVEDLEKVIAVGEKLWKLIEAGRPVVSFKAPVVHALPMSITCWHQLEKWQAPRSQLYEIVYKNKFGVKVVSFRFRVSYAAGGKVNGVGSYLANVTVQPAELRVSWGFDFDAEVEVGRTLNMGTHTDPIAGLQLQVRWKVKNVLNEVQASENFFVQGDGLLKRF